jgi:hypothetical protein
MTLTGEHLAGYQVQHMSRETVVWEEEPCQCLGDAVGNDSHVQGCRKHRECFHSGVGCLLEDPL